MSTPPIDEKKQEYTHEERRRSEDIDDTTNLQRKLANPLANVPHDQVQSDARNFANNFGLSEHAEVFAKASLVAQDPEGY